jgi:predicted N-acetyltransferase YhbS
MSEFRTELLTSAHDLAAFDCGVVPLNTWLTQHALRAQAADAARVFVWTRPESAQVLAYFAIAPTVVAAREVSRSLAGGYSRVPAFLLARLALERQLHGRGLGGQLLRDALERIVVASRSAAGRLIVVDAIDDSAAAFYRHIGFRPVEGDPEAPQRLVMKVATARKALGD